MNCLQVTHCWMYFGRHDTRYWPYLCNTSPFSVYLSVGLTTGTCLVGCGDLSAVCSYLLASNYGVSNVPHTLILGLSDISAPESFCWRAAEVASARTAINRPFWLVAARTTESIDRFVDRRSDMMNE